MSAAATDLSREDYRAIRAILLGYRAEGVAVPLLPIDVDLDGDGICDSYGLGENDEVVVVSGAALEHTVYVSDGDDITGQGAE